MNVIFDDDELFRLIETGKSVKYKKLAKDKELMAGLTRVYKAMRLAASVRDLPKSLHYERLKHGYAGLSSVRIANGRIERLILVELENGLAIRVIEFDETHYGNHGRH